MKVSRGTSVPGRPIPGRRRQARGPGGARRLPPGGCRACCPPPAVPRPPARPAASAAAPRALRRRGAGRGLAAKRAGPQAGNRPNPVFSAGKYLGAPTLGPERW